MLKIKRVYEQAEKSDGVRVLVDRLWPRGLSKEKAHIYEWVKDIAPSDTLRKWFNHDVKKWDEFQRKYKEELTTKSDAVNNLKEKAKSKTVTLVFGAKDTEHNQAVVLKTYLEE